MKILHIIPQIESSGGDEKIVIQLANEMSLSDEITIVTLRDIPDNSIYIKGLSDKVELITLDKKKGLNLNIIFKLFLLMKSKRPDVVTSHLPAVFPYLIFSIVLLKDILFIHVIHSLPRFEEPRKWMVKLRTFLMNRGRICTVVLSEVSNEEMKDYYGVQSTAVIRNGISKPEMTKQNEQVKNEIELLKKDKSTKVLLSIGRIDSNKNQKMLCEIISDLNEIQKNVLLLVLGTPSDQSIDLYNQLIADSPAYVHFLGLKSNVADYLSHSDALCMTSFKEGLPLVVLESMSFGLPVLSTPAGGIPEVIVNGRNGFISENFSKESYLSLVSNFLTLSDADLERISLKNKLDFEQKYTIQTTARQYLSFYNQLLTRKQSLC